jgi:hypothetical protein
MSEKRNRGLFPTEAGNIQTMPGDNTAFLAHTMRVHTLPTIDNTDPAQVSARIHEYFEICAADDVKPTVTGFRAALNVSKTTLWEWKNGVHRAGSHQDIICKAYDVLEQMWEHYMLNGKINPVSGIFLGKNNFGYQDKQEYVLTPKTMQEQIDPATLEEKYSDLIESED